MRVDLSCDACGESYEPASVVRFSRRLTWAAARSEGWIELVGSVVGPHRCPSCAAEAVLPVLPGTLPAAVVPGATALG